jgi:hypothetical protein
VAIDASGWKDIVVWNPHLTMKARFGDRGFGVLGFVAGFWGLIPFWLG